MKGGQVEGEVGVRRRRRRDEKDWWEKRMKLRFSLLQQRIHPLLSMELLVRCLLNVKKKKPQCDYFTSPSSSPLCRAQRCSRCRAKPTSRGPPTIRKRCDECFSVCLPLTTPPPPALHARARALRVPVPTSLLNCTFMFDLSQPLSLSLRSH